MNTFLFEFLTLDWARVFVQFDRWNGRTHIARRLRKNWMGLGLSAYNNPGVHQLHDGDICNRNNGMCKCHLLLGTIGAAET